MNSRLFLDSRVLVSPLLLLLISVSAALGGDEKGADTNGNRLSYLNGPVDPYYPHRNFARLTTPQWIGEEGVDCVVTLGIDDMRDPAHYERYLRPILDRLKEIDGRAPVSIMTCQVSPDDPQLAAWLKEGLSIECHTADHPCPCLQKSDFAAAKSTYDRCIDLMFKVPGNEPVAFRMPCCDSLNTPSPRFWQHAFNAVTERGNFLQIDSSVFNIITGRDEELPREIRFGDSGEERFRRYIPFDSFVNTINDYPYPYVIGGMCWEFPCVAPSDWSAQHVQKPNNPDTVRDWKFALDAAVAKQGTFNLVFHPHGWIRAEQVVELIDYAHEKYGKRVKFLTFRECAQRLNEHLLQGEPLRSLASNDNGTRVLDLNNDGFMDVIVGGKGGRCRIWDPAANTFREAAFPVRLKDAVDKKQAILFGVTGQPPETTIIVGADAWRWSNGEWAPMKSTPVPPLLYDIDGDGECELVVRDSETGGFKSGRLATRQEKPQMLGNPAISLVRDSDAVRNASIRLIDVDGDGKLDFVYSSPEHYFVQLFRPHVAWSSNTVVFDRSAPPTGVPVIPPFVRPDGTNNGAWLHSGKLWWQNEDTATLPNHVDRIALADLQVIAEKAEKLQREREKLRDQDPVPVGVAKVDITPDYKVRLSGYAARTGEHEGVDQPIYARAVAIGGDADEGGGDGPAVIVAVENCGVPASMVAASLAKINEKAKLPRERFVVTSTHTHAAPWVNGFAPLIFPYDIPEEEQKNVDRYTADLTEKIAEAALAALANREPARLYHGEGSVDFAQNRRTPGGPVDHRVDVLVARSELGKRQPLAVLFNYACHNTTLGGGWNQVSGDWSGFASAKLEADYPDAVALSLVGCGADANPTPRGTRELCEKYGHALAFEVRRIISSERQPILHELTTKLSIVQLPWGNVPTREEFEKLKDAPDIRGHHARYYLKKLDAGEMIDAPLDYPIATWTFGDSLGMVFLGGEVVVDYALSLYENYEPGRLWVTAYANDVPCYIPSQRILSEGGYEAESSLWYYGRPGRLSTDVEGIILDAVQKLLPHSFYNAERQLDFPPPKDVDEALESFHLPPGFKIEVVAAEPLVVDPVAYDWAPDGSLWVVEMRDYPLGVNGKPGGRVKRLFDDDGDGCYDRATVFLDEIPYPTGVKVWRKGIIVSAAPQIFYAEDTNGDGKGDKVETLYRGFGEGNQQHRVNALRWGLDGWLYVGNGDSGGEIESLKTGKRVAIGGRDLRIRPDTGDMEAQSGQTQFGRETDDWGNWFGGNNSDPMWHYTLDDHYLRRNRHIAAPGVRKQVSVTPGSSPVFPASKTLMRFNDFHTANRFTSACSPMVYRDRLLGDDYYGNSFVCEPVHNLVHREIMSSDGATFTSRRAESEQQSEFLASTDNWFRPSMVRTGPDGALWISDMYRFVIEHPTWIPQEWQRRLDLRAGEDRGRIYRVYHEKQKPRRIENLLGFDTGELVAMLQSPNGTQRDLAQQMILWEHGEKAVEPLRKVLIQSKLDTARVHALCTLEGLGKLSDDDLLLALRDESAGVRRQAVRCAEGLLKTPKVLEAVTRLADDPDPFVRVQVAYSLGESDDTQAVAALAQLLVKQADDPIVTAAALSSARNDTLGELLGAIFAAGPQPPASVEKLLGMASALGDFKVLDQAIRHVTPTSGEQPAAWQLASLTRILAGRETLQGLSKESREQLLAIGEQLPDLLKHDDLSTRLAAIQFLPQLYNAEAAAATLDPLLAQQQPLEVQREALRQLASLRSPEAYEAMLKQWTEKTPTIRGDTLELLLASSEGAAALLKSIEAGKVAPQDVDLRRRQQLAEHTSDDIRRLAAKVLVDRIDPDRNQVIEQYAAAIAKLSGERARGQEVFGKKCSQCHKLDGAGHAVGPDLAALTDRSPQSLLVAILDPNRAIESKFIDFLAVTHDGRQTRGMLAEETSTSIVLLGQEGKQETILRSDLEELHSSGKSLMPEGMEKEVSPADMADLIAYLGGFRLPPKSMAGNKPAVVEPADDGSLVLKAAHARVYGPSVVFEQELSNLGYWNSPEDRAEWDVVVPKGGEYEVHLDYSVAEDFAGNTLAIQAAGQVITFKVPSTGTWDNYRTEKIGESKLAAGAIELTAASDGPIRGALLDLRTIKLVPKGE
jgi:putative membrane-bound dehydrogenase-like protein